MEVDNTGPVPLASFISDLPQLKQVDEVLRCGICYEFLHTAVITSCSHNYCSLCIRQYLNYKPNCPACFAHTTDSELRPNRALDDVVQHFPALRDALINSARKSSPSSLINGSYNSNHGPLNSSSNPNHTTDGNSDEDDDFTSDPRTSFTQLTPSLKAGSPQTPKKVRSIGGSSVNSTGAGRSLSSNDIVCLGSPVLNFTPTKNCTSVKQQLLAKTSRGLLSALDSVEEGVARSPAKKTSLLNYLSPRKSAHPVSAAAASSTKLSSSQGSSSSCSNGATSKSTSAPNASVSTSQQSSSSSARVSCPVCGVSVPERNINMHLNACLVRDKAPERVIYHNSRQRLPKLVYNLLNDKALKQELRKVDLSTNGSRDTLIKRHKMYVSLYNSECDKQQPRPVRDLKRQVEREEQTGPPVKQPPSVFKYDSKSAPEVIEKEQEKIRKKYDSQFSSLLADARRRRNKENSKPSAATAPQTKASPADEVVASTTSERNTTVNNQNSRAPMLQGDISDDPDADLETLNDFEQGASTSRADKLSGVLESSSNRGINAKPGLRSTFQLSGSSSTPRRNRLSLHKEVRSSPGKNAAQNSSSPCELNLNSTIDGQVTARVGTSPANNGEKNGLKGGPAGASNEGLINHQSSSKIKLENCPRDATVSSSKSDKSAICIRARNDADNLFAGYDDEADDELVALHEVSVKEELLTSSQPTTNIADAPAQVFVPYKTTQLILKQSPRSQNSASANMLEGERTGEDEDVSDAETQVFELSEEMLASINSQSPPATSMIVTNTATAVTSSNIDTAINSTTSKSSCAVPVLSSTRGGGRRSRSTGLPNDVENGGCPAADTSGETSPDLFQSSDEEDLRGEKRGWQRPGDGGGEGDSDEASNCSYSLLDDRPTQLQEMGIVELVPPLPTLVPPPDRSNDAYNDDGDDDESTDDELVPARRKRANNSGAEEETDCDTPPLQRPLSDESPLRGDGGQQCPPLLEPSDAAAAAAGGAGLAESSDSEDFPQRMVRRQDRKNPNCLDSPSLESLESCATADSDQMNFVKRPGRMNRNCLNSQKHLEDDEEGREGLSTVPPNQPVARRGRATVKKNTEPPAGSEPSDDQLVIPPSRVSEATANKIAAPTARSAGTHVRASKQSTTRTATTNDPKRPSTDIVIGSTPVTSATVPLPSTSPGRDSSVRLRRSGRRPAAAAATSSSVSHSPAQPHSETLALLCGPETQELQDEQDADPDFQPDSLDLMEALAGSPKPSSGGGRKRKSSDMLDAASNRRSTRRRRC